MGLETLESLWGPDHPLSRLRRRLRRAEEKKLAGGVVEGS